MTRAEAKNNLVKEFINEYGSTTPVLYDNDEGGFTKPTDSAWVKFSVTNNDAFQATLGLAPSRRYERMGIIGAQVYIPTNPGTYDGDILCQTIVDIYESKRLYTDIICGTGIIKEYGVTEEDWYLFNVIIPYTFDEKK